MADATSEERLARLEQAVASVQRRVAFVDQRSQATHELLHRVVDVVELLLWTSESPSD